MEGSAVGGIELGFIQWHKGTLGSYLWIMGVHKLISHSSKFRFIVKIRVVSIWHRLWSAKFGLDFEKENCENLNQINQKHFYKQTVCELINT